MADAQDLKSWDRKKSCEFESHHRHHFKKHNKIKANGVATKKVGVAEQMLLHPLA